MRIPSDEEPTGTAHPRGQALLGRFHVERALGHGGMGEVLLARDTLLDRRVALKRLLPGEGDPADARQAIIQEARQASRISNRHVAALHDVLDLGDQVLLVMEYVDGDTLRTRMSGPMALDAFWDLGPQCAEGVAAAHAHGVIHRDIKPENFMVTRNGEVKILDFGIARRSPAAEGFTSTSTEDAAPGFAGTLHYMAPEAHVGGTVDERSDIFALGVVFYEMLTGRRPFAGPTYGALVEQLFHSEPPAVHSLNPAAGPELSAIVARMLARSSEDRFATAADVVEALRRVHRGESLPAARAVATPAALAKAPHPSTARRRAVVLAVVAVAALASAVAWGLLAGPALPKQPNVAVLAPKLSGDADFDAFALGGIELVNDRLRKLTTTHAFQLASYTEGVAEKVQTATDARRVLGANLALVPSVTRALNAWRVQLDMVETGSSRRLATRTVVVPVSEPFGLLDGTLQAANEMLRLRADAADSSSAWGIRGAGTLRFYLQGLGRRRLASTPEAALAAVSDFEVACRTEPQGAVARAGLAAAELGAHRATKDSTWLARATASAREAVRLDPSRAEPHRILGAVLETAKRNAEAVAEYARALQLDPSDSDSRLRVARNYAHLGQPERELQCYQEAIEQRPIDWQPWWWLSAWHFRRGETDESIRCYRELILRAPLLHRGYASLGGLLVLKGNYDAAVDSLKLSLALRPTKEAFANLGTAYFNTGRFEAAAAAYNQAFQFGDADYVVWLNLGDAYYFLRDRKVDANAAYAQSVRLGCDDLRARAARGSPVDVRIAANVAVLFARLAQPDSARLYLALAVQADTSNSVVGYCAALTYWQFGERGRAMEWLAQAVRQGYPKVWLRDSPVFREWRGIPEFRALVGETEPGPKAAAARS